jgi:hypothetical protein
MRWDEVPSTDVIAKAIEALKKNSFDAAVAKDGADAREHVLSLVPKNAEVMVMTSVTLETLGIAQALADHPGALRKKLTDKSLSEHEKKVAGCVPELVIGSVHAVTEDGHVLIASATGSQLSAHVYGAGKVIWVVGAQKIVRDTAAGMRRIYEHSLPLEDARARAAYGIGSAVNNLLIMNAHPFAPNRIKLIFVPENIGF